VNSIFDIKNLRLYLWVGAAIFLMCTIGETTKGPWGLVQSAGNNLWLTIYVIAINCYFFEYIMPRLRWRKFFSSFLWLLLGILGYTEGLKLWSRLGNLLHINSDFMVTPKSHDQSEMMAYSVAGFFLSGLTRHIYNHFRLRQTAQKLRIEKQEAELNYLKSQTNPHFLFNTLNNIYSLARDKSDLAPESILRLSKILRYMLYEARGPYVAIEQELKIISDYISLERLRYDESLRINFNYDVEDMHQSLPPLILIPLVENAFKHGVSETRSQPFVDIHLAVAGRRLAFTVVNSMGETSGNGKENIGLSNLRRQLELLYSDYQVSVEQKSAEFVAKLNINLASHV